MGFLDDAIREHLELKRRRGADPTEIERAEREALAPARRAPEPQEGESPQDELLLVESEVGDFAPPEAEEAAARRAVHGERFDEHEEEVDEVHDSEPELSHPDDAGPEAVHLPEAEQLPEAEHLPEEHVFEDEPTAAERPAPPEPTPMPAPAPYPAHDLPREEEHPPHLSQPTQEYEVEFDEEPVQEHEHGHAKDDVLEETPEFLQDTPDHDRLWFEQKPPKDFDFDR